MAAIAVILLWLATAAGLLGTYWWVLDLLSHFKVHVAALFLACCVLLAGLRHWVWAALAMGGVVLNGYSVVPVTLLPPPHVEASGPHFRVVSLNVEKGNRQLDEVADFLNRSGADAIVLQEIDADKALDFRLALPAFPYSYVEAARQQYGVVVLSRLPIVLAEVVELTPGGSRAARVRIEKEGSSVTLVGAHLPWPLRRRTVGLRDRGLVGLSRLLASTEGPLIAVGDLNTTAWSGHFRRFLIASRLENCAQGLGLVPTWPAGAHLIGIRIDHCLRSGDIAVVGVRRGPDVGSDHYPAITDLRLPERGGSTLGSGRSR